MAQTISISGSSPLDEKIRVDAINSIKNIPIDIIEKLGKLAKSEKAHEQLRDNWFLIKQMTGV